MGKIIDARGRAHDAADGRYAEMGRQAAAVSLGGLEQPSAEDAAARHCDIVVSGVVGSPDIPARRFGPPMRGDDGREYVWAVSRDAREPRGDGDSQRVATIRCVDAETGRLIHPRTKVVVGGMKRGMFLRVRELLAMADDHGDVSIPRLCVTRTEHEVTGAQPVGRHYGPADFGRYEAEVNQALAEEVRERPELFAPISGEERRDGAAPEPAPEHRAWAQ